MKFSKKDVVLGISNQKVFVRLVEIPWMPADELKDSLKFQVADLVPMPVDEAVLDFVQLEEIVNDASHSSAACSSPPARRWCSARSARPRRPACARRPST